MKREDNIERNKKRGQNNRSNREYKKGATAESKHGDNKKRERERERYRARATQRAKRDHQNNKKRRAQR